MNDILKIKTKSRIPNRTSPPGVYFELYDGTSTSSLVNKKSKKSITTQSPHPVEYITSISTETGVAILTEIDQLLFLET
jgi:hypothetical protein